MKEELICILGQTLELCGVPDYLEGQTKYANTVGSNLKINI
jgi:hypothetical protein